MSVDDWARREAERQFPMGRLNPGETGNIVNRGYTHDGAVWMARHLADALLSDEAVEAAEDEQYRHGRDLVFGGGCACGEPFPLTREGIRAHDVHVARAALQAAVDAVTKEARND